MISIWTKELIDNEEFVNNIEQQIKSIMKDGKITAIDIPEFIFIIMEIYNQTNLKINYDSLPQVIEEVIRHILDKYNLVPEDEIEQFNTMINMAIKLVLLKPNFKKNCLKKFKFCK